jgi:hypothetical protein
MSTAFLYSLTQADDPDPVGQRSLRLSSTAGGRVTVPGEGTFMYEDGDFVRLQAQAHPGFVFAGWSGTHSTAQNPTYVTLDRDHEVRADFVSTLDRIYVDSAAPYDPRPTDGSVSDPQENGTAERPFDSIQEAIDVAAEGASVIVRPGVYCENIDFAGKRIEVSGLDPQAPGTAAYPVIDGNGTGPVVTFSSGEDPNCLLMGFVITRGTDWQGGGIVCSASSPTIMNCLIVGNRGAGLNAAAVCCTDSNALFVNCTVADNYSGGAGGGFCLFNSDVTIANSILWGNRPGEILRDDKSVPFVSYCDVAGGWPGTGNLTEDPLFARRGYWADANDPSAIVQPRDPGAVWMDGDYHLVSQAGRWDGEILTWVQDEVTSVCVDTGDPASPVGQEPGAYDNVINMGAYGGTAQASKFHLENIQWNRPVAFADHRLKELVEAELWVWDPTPTDMLGLTSFAARSEGITDLTGLQYAANLQSLELARNKINDISPLSQLTNLQSLVLNNNQIQSLAPIVRLTRLENLDIHENQIDDLSPVSRLAALKRIVVYQNQITDISLLTALTSLRILDVRENPLEQEAYDLYIPQIEANNPGIDLHHDPLFPRHLTIVSFAGGSVIQPGEGIFTYEQGEIVRLEAQADPGFVFAGWTGSWSSTSNPLDITMNENNTIWANFAVSDSGP